ncbi:hypothetical protein [Psychrobacter sp. I-STPA10]|uniref:hypothetical protein n=1 Tax=Psychrobacter sp. I-STPA10 TaxID=2585769 RepID=UPI001E337C11|nr:hypothetical protein [Psychrobacter sp. I-STPA10]
MVNKPDIEDVDKIALQFVQVLISANAESPKSNAEIFEKATDMAIEWLAAKESRQIQIERYYPNWIDLSKQTSASELQLDIGRNYWFFAQCNNLIKTNVRKVIRGTVIEIRENSVGTPIVHLINTQGAERYIGLYYLTDKDGEMFSEAFKPAPPIPSRNES